MKEHVFKVSKPKKMAEHQMEALKGPKPLGKSPESFFKEATQTIHGDMSRVRTRREKGKSVG